MCGMCRKRIKKATATVNGQPIEDATNDLEDSGFEDEADDDSIYSDDEALSGATLHAPLNLRCNRLLLRLHHGSHLLTVHQMT